MNEEKKNRAAAILLALLKAGCYLALFLGMQILVSIGFTLVAVLSSGLLEGAGEMEQAMDQVLAAAPAITLLSAVLTLLVLIVFFLVREKNPLREAGLVRTDLSLVGAAAALTPALYLLVSLFLSVLPESLLEQYSEASASLNEVSLMSFLATAIGAPLVEEVVFRGLVQSRLERALPGWLAAVAAALLFGLCHGQIVWVIYAFLLGFLFGRMRLASRSVLPSLAAHFVFNLIGYLMVALESRLTETALGGGLMAFALAGLIMARRQIPRLFGFGKPKVS